MNLHKIPNDPERILNLALAYKRTGVSNRYAAIISSSVLSGYGITCTDSSEDVIDSNKIKKTTNDIRKEATTSAKLSTARI